MIRRSLNSNLTKLITRAIFKSIQQKAKSKGIPIIMDTKINLKAQRNKQIEPQVVNYRKVNVTFDEEDPKFKIKHKMLNKNYLLIPEEEEKVLIMPVKLPLSIGSPTHVLKFDKQTERKGITTPQPTLEDISKVDSIKTSKVALRK